MTKEGKELQGQSIIIILQYGDNDDNDDNNNADNDDNNDDDNDNDNDDNAAACRNLQRPTRV